MRDLHLAGARVVVVGGGRSGVAATRLLLAQGARVTLTDTRAALPDEPRLREAGVTLALGGHPADVFMGDVGSLAHGGALGTVAILVKQELLLVVVGGVFVLEGLSVIIQVTSFKLTGHRFFKMAPLHHHFELIGWAEPKIITRFLIIAVLFALFSLTTLKLR